MEADWKEIQLYHEKKFEEQQILLTNGQEEILVIGQSIGEIRRRFVSKINKSRMTNILFVSLVSVQLLYKLKSLSIDIYWKIQVFDNVQYYYRHLK